jgi:hypothetical protein
MPTPPLTVPATDILTQFGNATVTPEAPQKPPENVSANEVQSEVNKNSIAVGEFTPEARDRAAVKLAYFVGCMISFVILMVFVDYLFRMPATPDNLASTQSAPQVSPAPSTPSPKATPSVQGTPPVQPIMFLQEAAFAQSPGGPPSPDRSAKPDGSPAPEKPAQPEGSPGVQRTTAEKTPVENYAFVSNAIADRSSKMFDLIVVRALLPVFTALLGYIFGSQPSRSNT